MDPKLLAILKKSKAVEAKTNAVYGNSGGPNTHGGSKTSAGGLMNQIGGIDGTALLTAEEAGMNGGGQTVSASRVDATNPHYEERVKNSGLPAAVAEAMLKNPIPQAGGVSDVTADDIRELNPNYGKTQVEEDYGVYSDEDEHVFMTEQSRHQPKPRPRTRERQVPTKQVGGSGISEKQIKRMIAEEIAKVLPRVVENYFDKKVIKENMKLMKYVIKSQQSTKKRVQ
jgi:hypothetical protein